MKNSSCKQDVRDVSRDLHLFWIFFIYSITVPNFIIKGYLWQILEMRGPFCRHPWAAPKKPILYRFKKKAPTQVFSCKFCDWLCYHEHKTLKRSFSVTPIFECCLIYNLRKPYHSSWKLLLRKGYHL